MHGKVLVAVKAVDGCVVEYLFGHCTQKRPMRRPREREEGKVGTNDRAYGRGRLTPVWIPHKHRTGRERERGLDASVHCADCPVNLPHCTACWLVLAKHSLIYCECLPTLSPRAELRRFVCPLSLFLLWCVLVPSHSTILQSRACHLHTVQRSRPWLGPGPGPGPITYPQPVFHMNSASLLLPQADTGRSRDLISVLRTNSTLSWFLNELPPPRLWLCGCSCHSTPF